MTGLQQITFEDFVKLSFEGWEDHPFEDVLDIFYQHVPEINTSSGLKSNFCTWLKKNFSEEKFEQTAAKVMDLVRKLDLFNEKMGTSNKKVYPYFMEILLQNGALCRLVFKNAEESEYMGPSGVTAIHLAAACGEIDLSGPLSNPPSKHMKKTPLEVACMHNRTAIVTAYLDKFSLTLEEQINLVEIASTKGHATILEKLIKKFPKEAFTTPDEDRITPFHLVCESGSLAAVKFLWQTKYYDIHARDCLGQTPLLRACRTGHLEIVRYLKETCKSDMENSDAEDNTALHCAAESGSIELFTYLLKNGFKPNFENDRGLFPLHVAVERDKKELVEFLIKNRQEYGLDLSTPENNKNPLHTACHNGLYDMTELLLKLTVSEKLPLLEPDTSGSEPIDFAILSGDLKTVECFRKRNLADSEKIASAYAYYCDSDDMEMLELFIKKISGDLGKDLPFGKVLFKAFEEGKSDVLELYLSHYGEEKVMASLSQSAENLNDSFTLFIQACQETVSQAEFPSFLSSLIFFSKHISNYSNEWKMQIGAILSKKEFQFLYKEVSPEGFQAIKKIFRPQGNFDFSLLDEAVSKLHMPLLQFIAATPELFFSRVQFQPRFLDALLGKKMPLSELSINEIKQTKDSWNRNLLHYACMSENLLSLLGPMLQNMKELFTAKDSFQLTPIDYLIEVGDVAALNHLLSEKILSGINPLVQFRALESKRPLEILPFLLKYKKELHLDFSKKNPEGQTLFQKACQLNNTEILSLLSKCKKELNIDFSPLGSEGPALYRALREGKCNTLNFLLSIRYQEGFFLVKHGSHLEDLPLKPEAKKDFLDGFRSFFKKIEVSDANIYEMTLDVLILDSVGKFIPTFWNKEIDEEKMAMIPRRLKEIVHFLSGEGLLKHFLKEGIEKEKALEIFAEFLTVQLNEPSIFAPIFNALRGLSEAPIEENLIIRNLYLLSDKDFFSKHFNFLKEPIEGAAPEKLALLVQQHAKALQELNSYSEFISQHIKNSSVFESDFNEYRLQLNTFIQKIERLSKAEQPKEESLEEYINDFKESDITSALYLACLDSAVRAEEFAVKIPYIAKIADWSGNDLMAKQIDPKPFFYLSALKQKPNEKYETELFQFLQKNFPNQLWNLKKQSIAEIEKQLKESYLARLSASMQ